METLEKKGLSCWGSVTLMMGERNLVAKDPAGNLVEISCEPSYEVEPTIFKDDLYQEGIYVSGRNDFRQIKLIK